MQQHKREYARLEAYDDRVCRLTKELDVEGDGWVSNERYEEVKAQCDELQRHWDVNGNGGL